MERKVFINNMKKPPYTAKLLTETLPPLVAKIRADEKRITNDIKITNEFKSDGSSAQKNFHQFLVKRDTR